MKKLLILLLCLLLSSCTALPAEEKAFAVVLGVEQGAEWTVHARIPTYQTGGGYTTITGTGDTLSAAFASLDDRAPMRIHLSQLRLIVLSASVREIVNTLRTLADRTDLRLHTAVTVHDGDLAALMEALDPPTGTRLSKSIEVLLESRLSQGVVPEANLADILRMGRRQTPLLAAITQEEKSFDLLGAWSIAADGTLAARLDEDETQLLTLMIGGTSAMNLTIEGAALTIRDGKARLTVSDDYAYLALKMRAAQSSAPAAQLQIPLANACLELLENLTLKDCDPLGLGRKGMPQEQLSQLRWQIGVKITPPT